MADPLPGVGGGKENIPGQPNIPIAPKPLNGREMKVNPPAHRSPEENKIDNIQKEKLGAGESDLSGADILEDLGIDVKELPKDPDPQQKAAPVNQEAEKIEQLVEQRLPQEKKQNEAPIEAAAGKVNLDKQELKGIFVEKVHNPDSVQRLCGVEFLKAIIILPTTTSIKNPEMLPLQEALALQQNDPLIEVIPFNQKLGIAVAPGRVPAHLYEAALAQFGIKTLFLLDDHLFLHFTNELMKRIENEIKKEENKKAHKTESRKAYQNLLSNISKEQIEELDNLKKHLPTISNMALLRAVKKDLEKIIELNATRDKRKKEKEKKEEEKKDFEIKKVIDFIQIKLTVLHKEIQRRKINKTEELLLKQEIQPLLEERLHSQGLL